MAPNSNNSNNDDRILDRCESISTELLKRIEGLPDIFPLKHETKGYFKSIREMILSMRPARIMVVGRCKSGKSSLINAICGYQVTKMNDTKPQTGQAKWIRYDHGGNQLIDLLDTRGLQEQRDPLELDQSSTPEKSIIQAIKQKCPDVVLFLCKATEVHSASSEDLKICENIMKEINKIHDCSPPVIGVLTKCDELAPPHIMKLPTDNQRKQENIETQKNYFLQYLSEKNYLKSCVKDVVPTVAYAEYEDGECGLVIEGEDTDFRWNIDKLIKVMLKYASSDAQSSLVRIGNLKDFQKQYSSKIVNISSTLCGVFAATPIPVAGVPIVGAIQTAMIMYIGFVSGRPFSLNVAGDFLSSLGVSFATHMSINMASNEFVKLLPGLGNVISGTATAGATKMMGEAAIAFFIDEVSSELVKNIWEGQTNIKVS